MFWFQDWPDMKKQPNGQIIRITNDPLQFKGDGLFCLAYGKYILSQFRADPAYGKLCRENCMSPTKTCPTECLCRWFEFDPLNTPPSYPLAALPPTQRWWGQCGGSSYTGNRNCFPFSTCTVVNQWYSHCVPN